MDQAQKHLFRQLQPILPASPDGPLSVLSGQTPGFTGKPNRVKLTNRSIKIRRTYSERRKNNSGRARKTSSTAIPANSTASVKLEWQKSTYCETGLLYDPVCEVAIIRPGPIQGGMVHPFINRRQGREKVEGLGPAMMDVLGRTCDVPLFQEQAMQIAVVAAGFSAAEADRLRRSLATFQRMGTIGAFRERLFISGMLSRGYEADFAERCFAQIEGFGSYGFSESHSASFARLVYISSWLKCHHPAVFTCALLNSQPMGFYAPAQLVRDARDHGVEIRPVPANHSTSDCTLEPRNDGALALRPGFVKSRALQEEDADWIVAARGNGWPDVESLWRRAGVHPAALARSTGAAG